MDVQGKMNQFAHITNYNQRTQEEEKELFFKRKREEFIFSRDRIAP